MQAITNKPDILDVVQAEGLEFRQRGRYFRVSCPFHSEKTPSFYVDAERQRFKCFGCGVSGDVIDFVMKHKNISFRDALKYLGISGGDMPAKRNLMELKKCELVRKFNRWIQLYRRAICELLRLANRIDLAIKTPKNLVLPGVAEMYQKKEIYEYHLNILNGNDDRAKFEIYNEVVYEND